MNRHKLVNIQAFALLAALGVTYAGCASHPERTAGPIHCSASADLSAPAGAGSLKVYTAEAWMSAQDDTFSYVRSAYQILTPAGRCYMNVANQRRRASEEPQTVRVPVGNYVVVAEDAHRGKVTVPVTVEAGRTTVLRLD